MRIVPKNVQKLIDELSKLPGIGPKTAQRLTFYMLKTGDKEIENLGEAFLNLKDGLGFCSVCCNISEEDPCQVCSDNSREKDIICVVEEPMDIVAIEKTGKYPGLYHVLGGVISPIDGIGPEDLFIGKLSKRLDNEKINEVILATNPSVEGETTAGYIKKLISPKGVKMTRLARGLPVGSDIEYADEVTISRALEGRMNFE